MSGELEKSGESQVARMYEAIRALPQIPLQVEHHFRDGVYTRAGKFKAGSIVLGFKHRKKNILHISKGKLVLWDNINGTRTITAPHSEISVPGIQRAAFALEDVEGCNILETEETTVAGVESELFEPFQTPEIDEKFVKQLCENTPQ